MEPAHALGPARRHVVLHKPIQQTLEVSPRSPTAGQSWHFRCKIVKGEHELPHPTNPLPRRHTHAPQANHTMFEQECRRRRPQTHDALALCRLKEQQRLWPAKMQGRRARRAASSAASCSLAASAPPSTTTLTRAWASSSSLTSLEPLRASLGSAQPASRRGVRRSSGPSSSRPASGRQERSGGGASDCILPSVSSLLDMPSLGLTSDINPAAGSAQAAALGPGGRGCRRTLACSQQQHRRAE